MTVTGSRVIVGVDDNPAGLAALRWALMLARSQDVELIAVRTWLPAAHFAPLQRLARRRSPAPVPGVPRSPAPVPGVPRSPAPVPGVPRRTGGLPAAQAQEPVPGSWPRHGGFPAAQAQERARLLVMAAFWTVAGGVPVDVPVLIETPEGRPPALLSRWACRAGDILVVGAGTTSRRRGAGGSVSRYCFAHASCAVMAVPAPPDTGRARRAAAALPMAPNRAGGGPWPVPLAAGQLETVVASAARARGTAAAEAPAMARERGSW